MASITEFLEARIAEDEELAQAAIEDDCGQDGGFEDAFELLTAGREKAGPLAHVPRFGEAAARIIVWATPRRVLAECAAKRVIIEAHPPYYADPDYDRSDVLCGTCGLEPEEEYSPPGAVEYPCPTLKALAAVYADHPDYRQDWA